MDEETALRLASIGRITTLVGVGLFLILAVIVKVVFQTEPTSDGMENFIVGFALIASVALVYSILGGPITWGVGLRGRNEPWWPAALLLVLLISGAAWLFYTWVDSLNFGF